MTTSMTDPIYADAPSRKDPIDAWAVVDTLLLCLVFAVSSDMLVQTGRVQSLAWMLCYALVAVRIASLWPHYLALVKRNKLIFAYPIVCLASVVWSVSWVDSLVFAFQLTMTVVIASFLGWRYSLFALTKAVAFVLALGALLSLLHWATGIFPWPVYAKSGALLGLYSQKNMLGQRTVFVVIAILTLWAMPATRIRSGLKLAMILPLFLTIFALFLAKSTTPTLLLPAVVILWLFLSRHLVPSIVFIPTFGLGVLVLALGPLLLSANGIDPVQTILDAVGKESTLTGRTLIWDVARGVYADHPFLGVGYRAFWHTPQFLNEQLATEYAGAVTSDSFHNFILEILVSAGWPGLIAMLSLIAATIWRLSRLYSEAHSAEAAGFLVMVVIMVALSLLGTSLFRGHEFMLVLMVAVMVSTQEDRLSRAIGTQRRR